MNHNKITKYKYKPTCTHKTCIISLSRGQKFETECLQYALEVN